MPNYVKNRLELIGSVAELDAVLNRFGTYIPASISKTHDGKEYICKKADHDFEFCWMNIETGHCWNRNGISQQGLPSGYEIEVIDSKFIFPDFEKVIPPPNTDAYKDLPSQEVAKSDPTWWYNWNTKNWGTKWHAGSCAKESINIYTFETAWSSVHQIVNAISAAFPELIIKYSWADEDTGSNCGKSIYKNGLQELTEPESQSLEAYELAFELWPDRKDNYELIGGEYKYKEE